MKITVIKSQLKNSVLCNDLSGYPRIGSKIISFDLKSSFCLAIFAEMIASLFFITLNCLSRNYYFKCFESSLQLFIIDLCSSLSKNSILAFK
ncbi:hypothetical protein BpHYR1_022466 [Brachionus plicatilis]|uniref:Uncharacterized protein n=1 Tax=Brachionus plicatilis TaxID=10195 RepID=A0A3M7R153_BRAPC|nr:hypothetical protein BpHYR1_022466 [Brachionus plicatilis]